MCIIISIIYIVRPSITSNPTNQLAYQGNVVTLSCSATNMMTIEWLRILLCNITSNY